MMNILDKLGAAEWINISLALITAIYVFLTFHISKANRQMALESIRMREEIERPRIVAEIIIRNRIVLMLQISNIGKNSAINVRLQLDKDFYQFSEYEESRNIRNVPLFNKPIDSIKPNAKISFYLSQGFNINKSIDGKMLSPLQFSIEASYEFGAKKYREKIAIDLTAYLSSGGHLPEEVEQLEKIGKSISQIEAQLKVIASKMDCSQQSSET